MSLIVLRPGLLVVFIDSSVLMAAAISATGSARDLLMAGMRGSVRLVISTLVLQETERNLRRKVPRALPAFVILRDLLASRIVDPPESLIEELATVVDAKDAEIVAAAIHAQATYLVSYDQRHLLSATDRVFDRYGVRIARPDAVMARLRDEQQ
jgi:putative PIN family toxin of toxin-antitoxin system